MEELPVARGLFLCEKVIVEERTRNVSLINCFNRRFVEAFPSAPQEFAILALLIDGRGIIPIDLRITNLVDELIVYEQRITVAFPDPLRETRFVFRMRQMVFPSPGSYEFSLLVAESPIVATRAEVLLIGGLT